jgi:hypothetical protein
MPSSYDTGHKIAARRALIKYYQKHAGRSALPADRQYVALCGKQSSKASKKETSEINQMVNAGLIQKSQYVGIDRDPTLIVENQELHPEATWLCGDLYYVFLRNSGTLNPAIFYLDSTSLAVTYNLIKTVELVMAECPPETFLFVNVMLNNPHFNPVNFTVDDFPKTLCSSITADVWKKWILDPKCIRYSMTGYTNMATYAFRRNP